MIAAPVATLALRRDDIRALMKPADYLRAVEGGFRALHDRTAISPAPLSLEMSRGSFHAKAAAITLDRSYAAIKWNGNFPENREQRHLPTIQGAILLCDGESGTLLAIMDSAEVTLRRTAAASALAAQFLARPGSATILICGCGEQGGAHLEALRSALPLRKGFCWDSDAERARAFAELAASQGFPMTRVEDVREAASASDVIVTCTTATHAFLTADAVKTGSFIAAVGADNPHKSEIEPALLAAACVVVDSRDQCAAMGDLHHAIETGQMNSADVHAELAEVVTGEKPGRTNDQQITLFDSTGVAVQDVASAALIYERAVASGAGTRLLLAA